MKINKNLNNELSKMYFEHVKSFLKKLLEKNFLEESENDKGDGYYQRLMVRQKI